MDKGLTDFLSGFTNAAICTGMTVMRETQNGIECITFFVDGKPYISHWRNPAKKDVKGKPKHTGGKKPYLMLMIEAINELKGDDIDIAVGSAALLGNNIQWNTGLIVDKRTKKPLLYKDLKTIYKCGDNKLSNKIKIMKQYGILLKDKDGYKISPNFIKKGGVK